MLKLLARRLPNLRPRYSSLALLLLLGTALGSALYWNQLLHRQEAESAAARQFGELRASQLTEAVALETDATLRSVDTALQHLRSVYVGDRAHFDQVARNVIASYPAGMLQYVTVFGPDGYLVYSTAPHSARIYFGDREHFRVHADGNNDALFISQPVIGRLASIPLIQITRPIRDGKRFLGVIGIPLRPDYLSQELRSLRVVPDDLLAIVRPDGHLIARSHRLDEALVSTVPSDRPFLKASPGERGIFRATSTFDKVPLLFAWHRLTAWPLIVTAAINEDSDLASLRAKLDNERRRAGVFSGLALALMLGVAALSLGLDRRTALLQASETRYRALFDDAMVPILLIQADSGRIVDGNAAATRFYGYSRDQLGRMNIAQINTLPRERIEAEMREARERKRTRFRFQHRLADGSLRDVDVHSGPFEIDQDRLLYSIVQDVTEQVSAQRALDAEAARQSALLETATDGIHILDLDARLLHFSASFAGMLGYSAEQMRGMRVTDWDQERPAAAVLEFVRTMGLEPRRFETLHSRRDGSKLAVEVVAKAVEIAGERLVYASARDISERRKNEAELRIAAIAFESQEGMIVTDAGLHILRSNKAFSAITGYTAQEVVGKQPSFLQSGRHDAAFYAAMWHSINTQGAWEGEVWNRRKSGEVFAEWLSITAVTGDRGEVTHYVGSLTDITLRKAAEDEIRYLAFYDSLTRLPNRRLLRDRLEREMAALARNHGHGALLFIDLDNFKTLNDTLGHDVGDLLLQEVAKRLRQCVRDSDTVARLGGDEFVVLLCDLGEVLTQAIVRAKEVAEKLLSAMNQPYQLAGQPHYGSASIGVALFTERQASVDDLLKQADLAMYQAKGAGRNTLRFFDPAMQSAMAERAALEAELRQAMEQQQFELYFQPQVNLQGQVTGAEGLLRWIHPERGVIAPGQFIALAEETGLIWRIGQWVLESACAQLLRWAQDPATAGLSLAVNVSARQFHAPEFVDLVLGCLDRSGANAQRLKLELTESVLLNSVEDAITKMNQIRERGVTFSLDDFGTGFSSLTYLKRLPLDQLKIDQSFVRDILVDPDDAAITRTIVTLAQSLGLGVIAEGVEQQAQRDLLAALDCQAFQGYFFGRPMPIAAFGELLQHKAGRTT